jgi:hypothetical protein
VIFQVLHSIQKRMALLIGAVTLLLLLVGGLGAYWLQALQSAAEKAGQPLPAVVDQQLLVLGGATLLAVLVGAVMVVLVLLTPLQEIKLITEAVALAALITTASLNRKLEQVRAAWAAAVAEPTAIELLVLQVLPIQVAVAVAAIGRQQLAAPAAQALSSFVT